MRLFGCMKHILTMLVRASLFGVVLVLMACQTIEHSDKTSLANIRTQMAGQYVLAGNLDEAKRQLDMAIIADARFAPSHDMMGVVLQVEGSQQNLDKADTFFREAMRLDPNFMRAYNNYGVYLVQIGRLHDAIGYFEQAGSRLGYDGRIQALENLGLTWQKLGDIQRADEAFYRAIHGGSLNLTIYQDVLTRLVQNNEITQAGMILQRLVDVVPITDWHEQLIKIAIKVVKKSGDDAKLPQLMQALYDKNPKQQPTNLNEL